MKGVMSARGGRVFSTWDSTEAMTVVGKPSSSSKCASALTARVHTGQTGASTTAVTRSACMAAAMRCEVSTIVAGSVEPITV